ncbi:hypothetical protein DCS32_09490 [Dokdonia sp. Dokd-P16]|uniref:hypothetical protein n=1 Tax=Dokdonia sp. Dokd-P16 TaxID=2173169 RepID=UPI000D544C21|nr:hypothetical protein [Dokdonia sp. Dokd-P16]AWH74382.1 hypothetical protein DCS32_09490 [Dokdonia sp. Dokd-P16]
MQDVNSLFEDIVENSNVEIYLSYCPTIDDLVLGVRDRSKKRISGSFVLFKGKKQNIFFLISFLYDLGKDIETISKNLNERYSRRILNQEFSINNRTKGSYTSSEIEFISKCAANETTDNNVYSS